jgi:hypothetical protein
LTLEKIGKGMKKALLCDTTGAKKLHTDCGLAGR